MINHFVEAGTGLTHIILRNLERATEGCSRGWGRKSRLESIYRAMEREGRGRGLES